MIYKNLITSKGAMFGISARISLILVSIASLAIALNKEAFFESVKIQEISLRLFEAEDAILKDYAENYKNANFIAKGYASMSQTEKKQMWQGKAELFLDPWGNEWDVRAFVSTSATLMAYGELIEPVCVVIFSAGADGYHYKADNFTAANYNDCINNVGLNYGNDDTDNNDDYFYKFTTINYEIMINEDTASKLAEISEALYSYNFAQKNIRLSYCEGLSQPAANSDSLCDINSNGTYAVTELENVNYYPKSSVDATSAVYYNATTYNNSTVLGIENLLTEIGLPTSYATDLAGRRLDYNSNKDNTIPGPYYAEFYYKVI